MKKIILSLIPLILVVLIIQFSCSKQLNNSCPTCHTAPYSTEDIVFDNSYILPKSHIWTTTSNNFNSNYIDINLVSSEFEQFIENNLKLEDTEKNIFSVCLYVDKEVNSKNSFDRSNILAVSQFSNVNGSRQHDFIQKDGNDFVEEVGLKTKISNISSNSLHYISTNIVNKEKKNYRTIILISNIEKFGENSNKRFDYLLRKAKDYINNKQVSSFSNFDVDRDFCGGIIFKVAPSGDGKCTPPCISNLKTCIKESTPLGDYVCETVICQSGQARSILSAENIFSAIELNNIFDDVLHYTLRDSILNNSDLGKKYKDYFYDISELYYGHMNASLALETAQILADMNANITKLVNNTSQNDVFITSTMKNRINQLILNYKSVYNDSVTSSIFNDISQQLECATNLSISEIRLKLL